MNNDIKEILDSMSEYLEENKNDYEEIVIKNGFPGDSIVYEAYYEDIKKLLDYITNLQKENNNLKEDFKRHIDRINELTERSDNLQEENERLKELCDKYEEEHNTTFQKWLKELKGGEK